MVLEFNFVEKEPTANEEIKGLYDFGYLAKYGVWHPSDISFCVLTNGFIEISARAGTEYYNKTKNRYYYLEAEEYELFVKKIQYTLEYCEICNVQ